MKDNTAALTFCPTLMQMMESRQVQLPNGEHLNIRGTSTINNISAIRRLLQKDKPTSTLEIGLAFGASALTILATQRELREPGSFEHVAIDPYQAEAWKSAGLHSIHSAKLADGFTHIPEDSALALPSLVQHNKSFGLIYIDGSHIFENVFIDFFYCTRMLEMNGVVLFDDCTDKNVRKVLGFIDHNYSEILARENVVAEPTAKQRIGHALGFQQLTAYRKIGEPPRKWNSPFRNF